MKLAYSVGDRAKKQFKPMGGHVAMIKRALTNGMTVTIAMGKSNTGNKMAVIVSNKPSKTCPKGKKLSRHARCVSPAAAKAALKRHLAKKSS